MPLPGKTRTPTGSTSSMASLRLKGAALACLVQSGLKATCVTPAGLGPFGGDEFGTLGAATVEKDHVGIFGLDLIELAPDQAVIVEVGPTGEGDLGACGQHHFGFRAALGGEEIAAVDQGCGQVLVVHHRARAGPPGRAGVMPNSAAAVAQCPDNSAVRRGSGLRPSGAQVRWISPQSRPVRAAGGVAPLVVVERAFDAGGGAVEEVDLAPEHFFEVGFHAGVAQARDEGIEDIADRTRRRSGSGIGRGSSSS